MDISDDGAYASLFFFDESLMWLSKRECVWKVCFFFLFDELLSMAVLAGSVDWLDDKKIVLAVKP